MPLSGETFCFLEKRLLSIETLRLRSGHFTTNNKVQVSVKIPATKTAKIHTTFRLLSKKKKTIINIFKQLHVT